MIISTVCSGTSARIDKSSTSNLAVIGSWIEMTIRNEIHPNIIGSKDRVKAQILRSTLLVLKSNAGYLLDYF